MLIGKNVDPESLDDLRSGNYNAPHSVARSIAGVTGDRGKALRGVMKGFGVGVLVSIAAIAIAGCGGDNPTTFVLSSGSPTASPPSASASPSAGAGSSPESSSLPTTAATPPPDGSKIIIDSPDSNTTISASVDVSGTASVDKGTVVAVVLDAAGKELGRATTIASASKPDYGHFDVSVSFSGATSGAKGQIKVFGVSPRDGTTPTNYYYITVRFG
jgi:Immunoglobulin-like domain of bacterial spore germination